MENGIMFDPASLLTSSLFSQYGGGDKAGNGQGVAEGFQIDRLKSFQSFLKLNRKVGYVVHGITPEGINHHRVNFFFHHQSMSNNFHYSEVSNIGVGRNYCVSKKIS